MTNANDVRRAHRLVIALKGGSILSSHDADFLRSFLPELPKQKTLAELIHDVYDARGCISGNDWADDVFGELETWLEELHQQLKGLAPAAPAHPEFLETEADYESAPDGTIVACDDTPPCHKFGSEWSSVDFWGMKDDRGMSRAHRRVLRWGGK